MMRLVWIVCGLAVLAQGCKGNEDRSPASSKAAAEPAPAVEEEAWDGDDESGGTGTKMALTEGKMGRKESTRATGQYAMKNNNADPQLAKEKAMDEAKKAGILGVLNEDAPAPAGAAEVEQVQTRSWFPETFLFEPLVVTDDAGNAEVKASVPDRLTSWRVLALAHSRSGKQAGAVATFLGTLATYIDLVAPSKLRVGDRVELPIQVVNTTGDSVSKAVEVKASRGTVTGGGLVTVGPGASALSYARLKATEPGDVQLLAKLAGTDSVTRSIEVVPTGRPLVKTSSGTLAKPRKVALRYDGDTRGTYARLVVYSGARALLTEELARASYRGGVAEDAFALLMTGQAPQLLSSFGAKPDVEMLRKQRILLTQRAVRHARVFDLPAATMFARAAAAHGDDPILSSIARRAKAKIVESQLPDGTCGGDSGWTLQRLLVSTSECASAAADNRRVVIRASGAFERHGKMVDDPYTAAALLATKAGTSELRTTWKKLVTDAVVDRKGGGKLIKLPPGVERADGRVPSQIEATAMAVLALEDGALRNDLGASLLGSYSPGYGWGDGRANLVCMRAVLELFSEPLPARVAIRLFRDGEQVAEGAIDPDKAGEVFVLEARDPAGTGSHDWEVRAEPAIPGLAYSLGTTTYGPWPKEAKSQGAEVRITPPEAPRVGRPASIGLRAMLPPRALDIRIELPAGVVADTRDLETLQQKNAIESFEIEDGAVVIKAPAPEAGKPYTLVLRTIPTFAGTLSSGPTTVEVAGETLVVAPTVWTVTR